MSSMTPSSPKASKTTHLFVVGTGLIGGTLLRQLQESGRRDLRVVALARSKNMVWAKEGLALGSWERQLARGTPMDARLFVERMIKLALPRSVCVDCTGSEVLIEYYPTILRAGISIVTPNKKANSRDLAFYRKLRTAAQRSGAQFLYETNVGAGLPVIGPLKDMVATGDTITKIEGVFSGTLSYIFNTFTGGRSFSDVVREAQKLGLTEPDPRDDLSGLDVARKLLILAREVGVALELSDIQVENLTPVSCRSAGSVEEFYTLLEQSNEAFELKRHAAEAQGKVLRYVASLRGKSAQVRLVMVDPTHPCAQLSGSDNIFVITTARYRNNPLIIRGPGAGAEVTAAGVLADILRVS